MKFTAYFQAMRSRSDRTAIEVTWIERALAEPLRVEVQGDGRLRYWSEVPEMGGRILRVIVLPDGETVHNAFFDRGFRR